MHKGYARSIQGEGMVLVLFGVQASLGLREGWSMVRGVLT